MSAAAGLSAVSGLLGTALCHSVLPGTALSVLSSAGQLVLVASWHCVCVCAPGSVVWRDECCRRAQLGAGCPFLDISSVCGPAATAPQPSQRQRVPKGFAWLMLIPGFISWALHVAGSGSGVEKVGNVLPVPQGGLGVGGHGFGTVPLPWMMPCHPPFWFYVLYFSSVAGQIQSLLG